MKDTTTGIDVVDQSLRLHDDDDQVAVSPTIVSNCCDTATVNSSYEETITTHTNNEKTTISSTTSTGSTCTNYSTSSEAAVVVAHQSWMNTTATSPSNEVTTTTKTTTQNKDSAIPKAITLTKTMTNTTAKTSAMTTKKPRSKKYHPRTTAMTTTTTTTTTMMIQPVITTASSTSSYHHPTLITNLTTNELYQQLQKRLRNPDDIPSIPTLSSRNQRRRIHYTNNIPSTSTDPVPTTMTKNVYVTFRPVCTFVNYMSTKCPNNNVVTTATCTGIFGNSFNSHNNDHLRLGGNHIITKSLISLCDDDVDTDNTTNNDHYYDITDGTGTFHHHDTHFSSIVSVNGNDEDDMFLLSNLDTLDWGVGNDDDDGDMIDIIQQESITTEMSTEDGEPYRFSNITTGRGCMLQPHYGYGGVTAGHKIKHMDICTTSDHQQNNDDNDKTLFDTFIMPHHSSCHDDVAALFHFDL